MRKEKKYIYELASALVRLNIIDPDNYTTEDLLFIHSILNELRISGEIGFKKL